MGVVSDTNFNGEDDYYSSLMVIAEEEYIKNKGKEIVKSKLKTLHWLEKMEYHKEYRNCKEQYNVSSEKIFTFE